MTLGTVPYIIDDLILRQLPTLVWKDQMLREGFPGEEMVVKKRAEREHCPISFDGGIYARWRRSYGIDDPGLNDALTALEFDLPTTPQLSGWGIRMSLKVDRLFTDEDSLDDELRDAKARYEGETKPPFQQHQQNAFVKKRITYCDENGKEVDEGIEFDFPLSRGLDFLDSASLVLMKNVSSLLGGQRYEILRLAQMEGMREVLVVILV